MLPYSECSFFDLPTQGDTMTFNYYILIETDYENRSGCLHSRVISATALSSLGFTLGQSQNKGNYIIACFD